MYVNLHIFQPTYEASYQKSGGRPREHSRNHESMRYSWNSNAHNLKLIHVRTGFSGLAGG